MSSKVSENTSYKVVAFFVTMVLWITMLSRRDAVMTREMSLLFLLPNHMMMKNEVPRRVVVKLAGPRLSLQRYVQSESDLTVDLTRLPTGRVKVHLSQGNLSLPLGVKVLAIEPEEVLVDLKESNLPGESSK